MKGSTDEGSISPQSTQTAEKRFTHSLISAVRQGFKIITRRMSPIADLADRTPDAAGNNVGCFSVGYNLQAEKWMIVH
jgi:hypothetical protein